jgi:hypothetical protein
MTQIVIKEKKSSENYLGEEWLMMGNLLTKFEFDKVFRLAKETGYLPINTFWDKIPFSVNPDQTLNYKHEVKVSVLVLHQLQLICDAFQKSGDKLLESLLAEFESKLSCVALHPLAYPACMNYPSNEKVKPVRYILCGDYKIVYNANRYFVHVAFIAHNSRCKKLLKDKFSHW